MKRYYEFMSPDLSQKLSTAVTLTSHWKNYIRYFDKEYWFAKKKLGNSTPFITCTIVDSLGTAKQSNAWCVYRRVHFKKLFWFEYVIDFGAYMKSHGKESVKLYVKRHFLSSFYMNAVGPFIQTNVLEPLLYICMALSKKYLLHASSISKKGIVTAFAGHGGAGKTTTALNKCLREGYEFMGDDLVFIHVPKHTVTWFPRPLHLFWYNIFKIPLPFGLAPRIAFVRVLCVIAIKNCIRFVFSMFTHDMLLISTRIDIRTLYPQLPMTRVSKLGTIKTIGLKADNIVESIRRASDLRKDALGMIDALPKSFQDRFLKNELETLNTLQIYFETL